MTRTATTAATLDARAARIKLLLLDVDGVLTDGKILMHADGSESKRFDIKDGAALVWAQRVGLRVGLLSARPSAVTERRAAELRIRLLVQSHGPKVRAYQQILRREKLEDADVAYMGDDLLDLPVLTRVGFSAAPADAVADVRTRVDFVARAGGGNGAVRELVELLLRAQGRWDAFVAEWTSGAAAVMGDYGALLAALVALLLGLAVGKAWERYKLRDGRWIDRRKARQSPHYIIGLNFLVAGQIDLAIEELTKAAGLDADALEIHMILGNLYREKGQVGRAVNVHQALLQRPRLTQLEHAHVLLCLGLDFRSGGFIDRAHEAFKEVLRLDPGNRYALMNLQKLHEEQHQWHEAYQLQQQVAALDPRG